MFISPQNAKHLQTAFHVACHSFINPRFMVRILFSLLSYMNSRLFSQPWSDQMMTLPLRQTST